MRTILIALAILFVNFSVKAAEPIKELQVLAPFIGTWKTVGGSVDGSQNFEDVSKWEWAMGGKIVKITHSVNKGAYFGESLIGWDAQQEKIVYRYVNNAGFYTDGVITPGENGIDIHEFVRGAKGGPTETMANYRIDADGTMKAWSKFKADGNWGEASNVTYERSPDAVVIFKD